MSCKLRNYSGYAFAFLIGLTLVPGYQMLEDSNQALMSTSDVESKALPPGSGDKASTGLILATAYSRTCSTPEGSCTLSRPKPVGESCSCGEVVGTVVR